MSEPAPSGRGRVRRWVLMIGLAGLAGLIFSLLYWNGQKFSHLNYEHSLRLMIPSVTALIVSCQVILGTFFLSILGIKHTRHPVTMSPPSVRDDALDHREQPAAALPFPRPRPRL